MSMGMTEVLPFTTPVAANEHGQLCGQYSEPCRAGLRFKDIFDRGYEDSSATNMGWAGNHEGVFLWGADQGMASGDVWLVRCYANCGHSYCPTEFATARIFHSAGQVGPFSPCSKH